MLELEEFAKLQASIEKASSLKQVLQERALSPQQWLDAERHWHAALAKEIAEGRAALSERYLAAYLAEDGSAQPPVPEPSDATPPAAGMPAPTPHMPSYLRMGGGVVGSAGGLGGMGGALGGGISALTSNQQLRAMPPAIVTPVATREPPAPVPPPPVMPAPVMPAPVMPAPIGPALVTPPAPVAPPAVVSPAPSLASPQPRMARTAEHPAPSHPNATLPFQTPRPERAAEPPAPLSRGRRRRNLEIPAHIAALKGTSTDSTGTLSMDESTSRSSALPFQGSLADSSRPSERKRLSVDQFAWIVATVESTPFDGVDAVLSRMRMTRSQYAAMGKYWQAELAKDPALAAQFAQALTSERAKRRT